MYPTYQESQSPHFVIYDPYYDKQEDFNALLTYLGDKTLIYAIATPTTELVDVSPFPVSPTDTYTSVNTVSFYKFEHKKNKGIWSCGEYNATDGKYHIVVQPQGKSPVDIALDAPLRKVGNIADTIEFPSDTEGKALITRNFNKANLGSFLWWKSSTNVGGTVCRFSTEMGVAVLPNCIGSVSNSSTAATALALCSEYNIIPPGSTYNQNKGIGIYSSSKVNEGQIFIYDPDTCTLTREDFKNYVQGVELIYQITPTTELVDAPQIEEAESYSMVVSQGGKSLSWSSFETE
jgi:hypothetical protein